MMQKFETTGSFDVQPGRRRKRVHSTVDYEETTALQDESAGSVQPCTARGIARTGLKARSPPTIKRSFF